MRCLKCVNSTTIEQDVGRKHRFVHQRDGSKRSGQTDGKTTRVDSTQHPNRNICFLDVKAEVSTIPSLKTSRSAAALETYRGVNTENLQRPQKHLEATRTQTQIELLEPLRKCRSISKHPLVPTCVLNNFALVSSLLEHLRRSRNTTWRTTV